MTDEELNAIRERRNGPVFEAHLTADPCRCGGCNPTAHPKHPLYGELGRVREDVRSLLTEVERQAGIIDDARRMLRIECAEIGDNDWPDSLHLADVIEKHLARPLHAEVERLRASQTVIIQQAPLEPSEYLEMVRTLQDEIQRLRQAERAGQKKKGRGE